MSRSSRACAVLAALLALGAPSPATAGSRSRRPPRPNLVVSGGAVTAGTARIFGSFTVANRGAGAAAPSRASLRLRTPNGPRTAGDLRVGRLTAGARATIAVSLTPPALPAGSYPISACANSSRAIPETSRAHDCRRIGTLVVPPAATVSAPANPIPYDADTPLKLTDDHSEYWVDVPSNYDASRPSPVELLVWLHGCGGEAAGDIYTVSPPGPRPYISVAVGGREDACWDPNADEDTVRAAIADVETHFAIDPHRVVLGGYSSGGDLSYRLAFDDALRFAGVLAENTSPFRDTGSTAEHSLGEATWKFNAIQLAHTEDEVYPLASVVTEIDQMRSAGFPVVLVERRGHHYDNSTASTGTDHDLQSDLLPHLSDGWHSP